MENNLYSKTKIALNSGVMKQICRVSVGDIILGVLDGKVTESKILDIKIIKGSKNSLKQIKFSRHGGNGHFDQIYSGGNLQISSSGEYVSVLNLNKDQDLLSLRYDYCMTPIQEQILLGMLLGDANLSVDCKNIIWNHVEDDHEYFKWISRGLGNIVQNDKMILKSGYGSVMHRGYTIDSDLISNKFSSFKKDGRKIVPEWVIDEITPLAIAFWYMDDGSLSHSDSQEDRANFATCGFTEEDNLILANSLKKFNINANMTNYKNSNKNSKYKNKHYFRLSLNSDDAEKLFLLVAPYIPRSMHRKLPERYRNSDGWLPEIDRNYKMPFGMKKFDSLNEVVFTTNQNLYSLKTSTGNYFANSILVKD